MSMVCAISRSGNDAMTIVDVTVGDTYKIDNEWVAIASESRVRSKRNSFASHDTTTRRRIGRIRLEDRLLRARLSAMR